VRQKTQEAMEMLWKCEVNLPQAAEHAGLTQKEIKMAFAAWVLTHPPTYTDK